jgi:hypothetical protein
VNGPDHKLPRQWLKRFGMSREKRHPRLRATHGSPTDVRDREILTLDNGLGFVLVGTSHPSSCCAGERAFAPDAVSRRMGKRRMAPYSKLGLLAAFASLFFWP